MVINVHEYCGRWGVLCQCVPCPDGLMVSVSASHTVGREFVSRPGHTKDHHKNSANLVCGTGYGDMHLKDLLGSFVRVGYRIPVPDFHLVLHGLRC